jgi:hypothetical protein
MDVLGKSCERSGLHEGLSAAESYARKKGVFVDFGDDGLGRGFPATLKIVGVGVMAARAVVRASLGEYGEPHALAVDNGVVNNAGDSEFHGCRLPFIEKPSSTRKVFGNCVFSVASHV